MSAAGDVIVSAELLDGVPKSRPNRVKALFDYKSGIAGDLNFSVGEFIEVTETVDTNWWRGKNTAGEEGLFPANYVEAVEL